MPNIDFIKKNTKKTKLLIVVIIIIILIMLSFFVVIKYGGGISNLTGFSVFDPFSNQGNSETGITSDTSATRTSSSNLQFKNIEIKADIQLQDYSIPISTSSIEIQAAQIIILNPDIDIKITLDRPMQLKDFTGKSTWKDGKLILEGELAEYLADYIQINWKSSKDISLRIEEGKIKISDINIKDLKGIASGDIQLSQKLTFNLDRDKISIKDYRGSFESSVTANTNTLILDGKIGGLSSETSNFNLDIK